MSKADTVAFEYAKENGTLGLDYNQIYDAVKYGYHQAEKDLELGWEDIASINNVVTEMLNECGDNILYDTEEKFCREVLKRLKKRKGKKYDRQSAENPQRD